MTDRAGRRPSRRHDPGLPDGAVVPPEPSSVDLHAHSVRSDGVLAPSVLVAAVAAAGVRTFALTDHDTLAGYRELIAADALPAGLTLIPGVEINALVTQDLRLWEGELHILGFGMDPDDEVFESTLATQRDARRTRFTRTVALLREIGLPIDLQVEALEVGANDALGRPTIARALVAAGFAASVEDAFTRIIGHGGPGHVRREGLGPAAAIGAIRAAGGLPVLAHFREAPERIPLLRELQAAGLGGLEVHHRSFDGSAVEAVGAVARELVLEATGGSDYHGDLGTYADAHASLWVPAQVGTRLLAALHAQPGAADPSST